jgi:hypothetical protein
MDFTQMPSKFICFNTFKCDEIYILSNLEKTANFEILLEITINDIK